MTGRKKRNLKKRAFTLIELLVVIAVIAILAGLLLPSLNKSRDRARTINCAGQIKQVGSLFHQYANDHNDLYPASYDGTHMWSETLYNLDYIPQPAAGDKSILMCGSYKGTANTSEGVWVHQRNTYGLWQGTANYGVCANTQYFYLKRQKIESDRPLLGDSTHSAQDSNWLQTYVWRDNTDSDGDGLGDTAAAIPANSGTYSLAHLRHQAKVNILFNDGSADARGDDWMRASRKVLWQKL